MKSKSILNFLFSLSVIILIWYLLSLILNTPALPDPITAFIQFARILDKLLIHILYSLFRIIAALILSVALAVPAGLVMGRYNLLDRLFSPLVYMVYPIPKVALLPVVMLILGLGNVSKITLIFIIVFFQVVVACRDEAVRITKEQYYFMESIGSSEYHIFRHLVFPQSLPAIITSIRLSLGTSIAVLFFSENYGTEYGIGYFIIDSWMRINYPDMFAGIIGLSLMGIFLYFLVDILEKKICPWK